MRRLILSLFCAFTLLAISSTAMATDFRMEYKRGKLWIKQKLYFDAIRSLKKAVKTQRGKTHFAAHYHLARAYYWLPDIQKAMKTLKKAKGLIKRSIQRRAHQKLSRRIKTLYGRLAISPEVDPEDVGKLQLEIKPKNAISHSHKKRAFRAYLRWMKKNGGLLLSNNQPIYLPKGDYVVKIKQPQCLKYGFIDGGKVVREFSVGDGEAQLSLKEKSSCACQGGQKLYKEGERLYCNCPPGTGWDKGKGRCIVAKPRAVWPWVVAVSGVVVAGGTVVAVLLLRGDGTKRFHLAAPGTKDSSNSFKAWVPAKK